MEYRISEFAQDLLEDIRGFCIREVRMQAAGEDHHITALQKAGIIRTELFICFF